MQHLILFRPYLLLCKQALVTTKARLLTSLLLLLAAATVHPAMAGSGFYKDFIIIDKGTTPIPYYYTNNEAGSGFPNFQNVYLGSFDRGTGQLRLGAEANTFNFNGDEVQDVRLFYRVYPSNINPASLPSLPFVPLILPYQYSGGDNNANNKKWSNPTDPSNPNNFSNNPNLLAGTSGPGNYTVEVYYQLFSTGSSGNQTFYENGNGGQNYKATFDVTGSVPVSWNGSINNNWFEARNWSPNAVPTFTTDATISYISGATNYPTIYDGVAQVRTLSILGNNNAPGGHNYLQGGELQIFGDFRDANGGFGQTGGVFTLAGSTQTFDGASFIDVHIQGGGVKTLSNRMDVTRNLLFTNGGGVLVTRTDNSTLYNIDLAATGQVTGESESNYVLGIIRGRALNATSGNYLTFGNIGVTVTATTGDPGTVIATRLTGFAYAGTGTKNTSIKRSFFFGPIDNPNNLNFNIAFTYLSAELNGLNASNLELFRSTTGAAPFENLGNSGNSSANTLTRIATPGTLAATFTLGEGPNPLPVTLVSFTATGTAQGAALKWLTASEVNNKGFGVERQVAGATTWQTVGYVNATNQANGSSYSFLDKTISASATQVYYRLRQEDFDGSLHYSPVATISRAAQGADLTLSPVPLQSGPLAVSFAEAGQAGTEIVVLNMQGQRVAHYTSAPSTDGAVSLPLDNLAAGVYVLSVQVPGQATRHARFVKQ